MNRPSNTMLEEIKETFNARKIYQVRWVWYHTIMVFELLLIIFLLAGILIKI
jgi:hypothetical protein